MTPPPTDENDPYGKKPEKWSPMLDFTDGDVSTQDAENFTASEPAPPVVPTPVAVALKHERESKAVPTIVASGRGAIAEQILQLAFANDVKVREDAALVEILAQLDVDSPIPLEAYAAVAEILAYVYKANNRA